MGYAPELLEAVRKILNETRQDRLCREYLASHPSPSGLGPFLGSLEPAFLFLGLNPAGYDVAEYPSAAEDYLDFAVRYFKQKNTDKASFAAYLPYAAINTADYETFGEVAMAAHVVPIPTRRANEIPPRLLPPCWARTVKLVAAVRPKLILVHGAAVWKFLAGVEESGGPQLTRVPESHQVALNTLLETVEADKLPFQSGFAGAPEDFKPWLVALPHLGGAGGPKAQREKLDRAVREARRLMHGVKAGVRIRKPV